MTHVLIDMEIVKAIGLSISFMGMMLSIVAVGIAVFIHKFQKRKGKSLFWMAGLIAGWAVFLFLDNFGFEKIDESYVPVLLEYSLIHLIAIGFGGVIFLIWLIMLPKFWNKFNKRLMVTVGVFAFLSVAQKFTFPYIINSYMGLLHKIIIIIPPLIGFFMIIKSYIGKGYD